MGFDTILGAVDARSDASIAAKFDPTTVATHRTNERQNSIDEVSIEWWEGAGPEDSPKIRLRRNLILSPLWVAGTR